ncbi:site-specific integrase [Paracraurococcus lichenis]|uniref:Tyr recombinase domain-containing protein n=1 Tax=Paracraurococcus lichenis TaxID=3064888 RepID=A0ABT9ECV4_9PROT|nr:hypothetical protein [Paracraurococcus sp. LOR1-02]MDO9713952.1 hypothetical protein [Paracraurococcus sp. LOR1-02]
MEQTGDYAALISHHTRDGTDVRLTHPPSLETVRWASCRWVSLTSGWYKVAAILKRMAGRAGLNATRISGHSCRVGMAQDLVASGADTAAVQQTGRRKTPVMPARYVEHLEAECGAVARYHQRRGD